MEITSVEYRLRAMDPREVVGHYKARIATKRHYYWQAVKITFTINLYLSQPCTYSQVKTVPFKKHDPRAHFNGRIEVVWTQVLAKHSLGQTIYLKITDLLF